MRRIASHHLPSAPLPHSFIRFPHLVHQLILKELLVGIHCLRERRKLHPDLLLRQFLVHHVVIIPTPELVIALEWEIERVGKEVQASCMP